MPRDHRSGEREPDQPVTPSTPATDPPPADQPPGEQSGRGDGDDAQQQTRSAEDRPDDELPVEGDEDYVPASQDQDAPFLLEDQQAELEKRNEESDSDDEG